MELQIFNSTEFGSVRTAIVNGEIMFVGKDVADILGYQNGSRDINRHVDEDDRHKAMIFDGNQIRKPSLSMSQDFIVLFFLARCLMRRSSSIG